MTGPKGLSVPEIDQQESVSRPTEMGWMTKRPPPSNYAFRRSIMSSLADATQIETEAEKSILTTLASSSEMFSLASSSSYLN